MLPGSHLYPLCLSPKQTAKGPMEMHPVPLVSLCPRSLSGCGSINLRQEGKHKIEINNSGATFNTRRTRAGGHIPELLLPPRDNTVTQRVLSGTESYAGVLFLYWLSLFLPFLP